MIRVTALFLAFGLTSLATAQTFAMDRNGQTITIEPYAPNVVRVTLSLIAKEAQAGPGYGVIAKPDQAGWSHLTEASGADTFKSPRMSVRLAPAYKRDPEPEDAGHGKVFLRLGARHEHHRLAA